MANQLSKSGIVTTNAVEAWHVTQSIDAFTGISAYDITLSGSLNLTGSTIQFPTLGNLTSSGTITATGNISSSNNLFGKQATLSGRLNTNIIQGETGADTIVLINDNLNVNGNITASGHISGPNVFKIIDNTEAITIAMSGSTNGYGSGAIIALNLSSETNNIKFRLPSPPASYKGFEYEFLVSHTAGSGVELAFDATVSENLNGIAICDDGNEDITGTVFTFAATKAIKGTRVKCINFGSTGWHITAFCLCDLADVTTS